MAKTFPGTIRRRVTITTEEDSFRQMNEELNIQKEPFSSNELSTAINNINNGKYCGLKIRVEVWKHENFHSLLLKFCNSVYDQHKIKRWTEGFTLPFP